MIYFIKHWRLIAAASVIAAAFGSGCWVTVKFYKAAEVKQLKADIETLRGYQAKAAKAEKDKADIERKYLKQSEKIEDLRRSDATVDSYLNTPIPAPLQRLLNAK